MKAILLIAVAALAGCSSRKPAPDVAAASTSAAPLPVRVARAEARQIERAMFVTGSLLPDETVNLGFEVAGTVAALHTDFGRQVKKGQVLGELDRREITWQLERSRAQLAQALARVGLSADQESARTQTTPEIRQAEAQSEDARSKYESAQRLVKSGDISRERFTELEKAHHARKAALEATRDSLRMQLAAIDGLRADVKLAEKRLADTTLRAPFDGAVTARLASPGQFLKENTPIFTIVKASPLRLRAEIPESGVAGVRVGTALTFSTDAAGGAEFHAVVRELNPALDAKSRSLTAEARLVESDGRLKPGMFVQVRLVTARNVAVVAVPKAALYTVAGLTKIFVVRGDAVVECKVQPGEEIGDWVSIPDVLKPGDQVATTNQGALTDGMRVAVQG